MPWTVSSQARLALSESAVPFEIPFKQALLKIPHLAIHQFATDAYGDRREFHYLSEGVEWFCGTTAQALLGDADLFYDCILPDDRVRLSRAETAAASSGEPLDLNVRFATQNRGLCWCRILSVPRRHEDGSLMWDGVYLDATSEIEGRRQLRDLNGLLDLRLNSRTAERDRARASLTNMERVTRVGSWVYDPAKPTLEWSESVFEIFAIAPGHPPPSFAEFMDYLPDDQRRYIEGIIDSQDCERTWEYKLSIRRTDGSIRTCWTEARLERKEDGSGSILFGICRDITDHDTAEVVSKHSHKMEAIGQLTSGLAHDFNNLLAIAIGNLDLIKEESDKESYVGKRCQDALSAAIRGADLTQQLLSLSRRESVRPRLVHLNDLIERFQCLLDSTVGRGARLITNLGDDGCTVKVDPVQFESALLNLVINAKDAMPSGGALSVETSLHHVSEAAGEDHLLSPGSYVLTKVSDTGTGMPKDVIERAFEPFYTTKKIGEGTGLGLSMVSGFAKQAGGDVEIISEVGRGTSILLYLPCHLAMNEIKSTDARDPSGDGAKDYTVLLVDDNPAVRNVTEMLLRDIGYAVMTADSGLSALSLLRHVKADVLLTDVLMAHMTGPELALAITEKYPEMRVIYTSGFGDDWETSGSEFHLLAKPFTKLALSLKLKEAINSPSSIGVPTRYPT